jgi:hypothetical protein
MAEVALKDGQSATDASGNRFTLHAVPRIYGGEIGARTRLFNRLDLAAALWVSYLENETVFSADVAQFVPSDASRRIGFDFEARARVLSWLSADFDLAQASATAVPNSGNGGAVALAPKIYFTGGLTAQRRGLRGALRFRYLGERPAFDESSAQYQTYHASAPARVVAQPWFVLDAYVAYRWRFLEAQLMVQNLLNSTWREAQFGNQSCTRDEAYNPANPNYAVCGATLAPAARTGVADVHFTPGVPINLQFTLKAYF